MKENIADGQAMFEVPKARPCLDSSRILLKHLYVCVCVCVSPPVGYSKGIVVMPNGEKLIYPTNELAPDIMVHGYSSTSCRGSARRNSVIASSLKRISLTA